MVSEADLIALDCGLDPAVSKLVECVSRLGQALDKCGLPSAVGLDLELAKAVHTWSSGHSFEEAMSRCPDGFEGRLVRHLRSLYEFLRQLAEAAVALGNTSLKNRFAECIQSIQRGIPFANSLYLRDE